MSHFFAFISRMKLINRWALMRNTIAESLSVHSHEVAIIAHALCVIGNKRLGKNHNADRAAVLALYHDASEIITGDMPTPVKYFNSSLSNAYKDVEQQANNNLLKLLPKDLQGEFDSILMTDDSELELKKIIKAADKISALIKCIEELKMGNQEFVSAKQSILQAINKLNVTEAEIFLEEFIPGYSLTLDELQKN